MHGLNRLVLAGKVLYLGISDTPAWIVSKANQCKIPFDHLFRNFTENNIKALNCFLKFYYMTDFTVQTLVTTALPSLLSTKAAGPLPNETLRETSCPCVWPKAWPWLAGTCWAEATSKQKSSVPAYKKKAVPLAQPPRGILRYPMPLKQSPNVRGRSLPL